MHIFLTGEIQIGKSTAIREVVRRLGLQPGGFLTEFEGGREEWPKTLYLKSLDGNQQAVAARICENERPHVYTEAFDVLGVKLLRQAKSFPLIVMDECGRFEQQSRPFQKQVLSLLDGQVPVLGVVRKLPYASWLDTIKAHPGVQLIEVTERSRDGLSDNLTDMLRPYLLG